MSIGLLYLLVVSVSTGLFYNVFGEKIIFLFMIILTISRGKLKFNKVLFISILMFPLLVIVKSVIGGTFSMSGTYHSLWVQQVKIIELFGTFLMCSILRKDKELWNKNTLCICNRIFNFCYYITILLTVINLIIRGRLLYRHHPNNVGIIYAPQFFLFYAIIIGAVLTRQIIRYDKNRLIKLIALFINTLFVLLMSYTTQMLFFILTITMVVIFELLKVKKAIILCILSGVLFILLAPSFMPSIILKVNEHLFSNNPDVSLRLIEIANFFSNGDFSDKAIGERVRMIQISKDTFMKYPYLGVPFNHYNNGLLLTVGGHQEWIDNLARYGIVGFALFIIFIVSGFKWGIPVIKKNMSEMEIVLTIIFIIYGFFNPFMQLSFVTACMIGYMLIKADEISCKKIRQ